eukprot:CAMPEP_0114578194 /NCGR_PEP_ID=MMETSP0125-20121206/2759_1 /TAXON_ID=485358 ORGANISM="Aristerostoma sp., Strain ATCC 50986" /NCGR_SAMPLE_ID=MMETSP0125 /ASSEMBLY_ACC=CAM_ASM_000245 /LENGTH=152 /DNA_ID=CAMNT_0001768071 /DNA_START=538 /DNA_END=996 /DNA_ORIENTATION=-
MTNVTFSNLSSSFYLGDYEEDSSPNYLENIVIDGVGDPGSVVFSIENAHVNGLYVDGMNNKLNSDRNFPLLFSTVSTSNLFFNNMTITNYNGQVLDSESVSSAIIANITLLNTTHPLFGGTFDVTFQSISNPVTIANISVLNSTLNAMMFNI